MRGRNGSRRMGVDEVGVDKIESRRSGMTPVKPYFDERTVKHVVHFMYVCLHVHVAMCIEFTRKHTSK